MTEYLGLPLTIREHPRARRVLVKLVPGQGVEVVVPKRFNTALVPDILEEKRAWIERTRVRMEAKGIDLSGRIPDLPESIEFRAVDRSYAVNYLDRPGRVTVTENVTRLMVRGPLDEPLSIIESLQKFTARKAREALLPRLDGMSKQVGMEYSAMRVRRQKTRWGSCSGRGTISLNAKLLFLPVELVDHLLLHELCHTRQMDHSPQYWALVAQFQSDYVRLEDELRQGNTYVPGWFV